MKWLKESGQEVETNDNPANIAAAKAAGWKLAEDSQQIEIKTPKQSSKSKKGNK